MMILLIPAIIILGLAILGMAIRILLVKDGKFRKTCSSTEASGDKNTRCACDTPEEEDHENCKYYKEHHP